MSAAIALASAHPLIHNWTQGFQTLPVELPGVVPDEPNRDPDGGREDDGPKESPETQGAKDGPVPLPWGLGHVDPAV